MSFHPAASRFFGGGGTGVFSPLLENHGPPSIEKRKHCPRPLRAVTRKGKTIPDTAEGRSRKASAGITEAVARSARAVAERIGADQPALGLARLVLRVRSANASDARITVTQLDSVAEAVARVVAERIVANQPALGLARPCGRGAGGEGKVSRNSVGAADQQWCLLSPSFDREQNSVSLILFDSRGVPSY